MMKAMKQLSVLLGLLSLFGACNGRGEHGALSGEPFNPSQPISITSFKPDSGGIATQMILEGTNFGNDTTGLAVYFVDSLGVKHKGGLVSTNGNRIFLTVPKLTYLRELDILVERKEGEETYAGKAEDMPFLYKTEIAVATIIGQQSNNDGLPTVSGPFASATLSAPAFLTLDDEDNLFITERPMGGAIGKALQSKNHQGQSTDGNLLMADTKNQELIVLQYNTGILNAPTFSNEKGEEAVYIPNDAGPQYVRLRKGANYAKQNQQMLFSNPAHHPFAQNNWKHALCINPKDKMLYTILWKGQLVRINPKTRQSEVLIEKVIPDIPNANGQVGSDNYYIFSPTEDNVMYVSLANYNMIKRIDLNKLQKGETETRTETETETAPYTGEIYAGLAATDGPVGGRGWEDGPLKQAKFNYPAQLAFTADGKLYIADANNHCIRIIDTTVPEDQAVVNTAVGIPGTRGFRDGGPDQSLFYCPTGVAVNKDGSELYVVDHLNHVVRKLAIQ